MGGAKPILPQSMIYKQKSKGIGGLPPHLPPPSSNTFALKFATVGSAPDPLNQQVNHNDVSQ